MQAFSLCRTQLGITKQDRLDCAKMYVATFPNCFFKGKMTGKNCAQSVKNSIAACESSSLLFGEKFACRNKKRIEDSKCNGVQSKRENIQADALSVRSSSLQSCNECYGNYHACLMNAVTEMAYDICIAARMLCSTGC